MLNYLASATRLGILYSAYQAARFCSNPKQSHEEVVKRIGRYLKKTSDKGIICKFDATKPIETFANTDFAGTWNLLESNLIMSTLSRSRCIIKIANCPIHWVSKMQSEVALSTTEAEYIALSQSTRDLIPIKQTIEFLNKFIRIDSKSINTYSTVFEDNNGALQLALQPKYRPRTKNICVKYHHFRQFVKNKTISIQAIDTSDQEADIMTKPLAKEKFEKFRKLIIG